MKKAMNMTKTKTKSAPKPGTVVRRAAPKDNVGELLLGCKTIEEMLRVARKEGVDKTKLDKAAEDFTKGVQFGLLRMRIGNLIRGARNRAQSGEAPSKGKSSAPAPKTKSKSKAPTPSPKVRTKKEKVTEEVQVEVTDEGTSEVSDD